MVSSKHIITALVSDRPGVLNRVASLFRRRGFNIDSIAVGASEIPDVSRMTIVVDGATTLIEQVRKQLDKVIDVIKVTDITGENTITRELALIKVKSTTQTRSEIMQIVDIFRAKIVDVAIDSLTVEVTGDEAKVASLYNLLKGFGIKEISRTGVIGMTRGVVVPAPDEET
jgi:acetolactate synthase I/III small subunit